MVFWGQQQQQGEERGGAGGTVPSTANEEGRTVGGWGICTVAVVVLDKLHTSLPALMWHALHWQQQSVAGQPAVTAGRAAAACS